MQEQQGIYPAYHMNKIHWITVLLDGSVPKEKVFDLRLIFSSGGMPSSHSAVVTSLATSIGIAKGFASPEFALSAMLAFITMTDAAGVRRAAGRQAAVLNKIVQDMISGGKNLSSEKLKELLGHTPFEVIIGALLGVLIALLCM